MSNVGLTVYDQIEMEVSINRISLLRSTGIPATANLSNYLMFLLNGGRILALQWIVAHVIGTPI